MWQDIYRQAIYLALFFVLLGVCINLFSIISGTGLTEENALMLTMIMLTIPHFWLYTRVQQKYGLLHLLLARVLVGTAISVVSIIIMFRLVSDTLLMISEYGWNTSFQVLDFMSDGIVVAAMFVLASMIALAVVSIYTASKYLNRKLRV